MKKISFSFLIFVTAISMIVSLYSCKTPSIIATRAIQQGDEMNNNRNYELAIMHYEKYIEVAPSLGIYRNPSMEADVYRKLSHVYSTQAKYQMSLKHLKSALNIDSTIQANKLEVIEDYRKIGMIYGMIGDFNSGIKNLNHSLDLNKGMEKSLKDIKKLSFADTYMSLAQIYFTTGQIVKAEDYINKALTVYDKINGEFLGQVEANLLLGKLNIEFGEIDKGIKFIKKSESIASENNINTARHDQVLSNTMVLKVDYEEALKLALKALEKAEETKIISQIIWMNIKVGDVYEKIGDHKKAEEYYQKALDIKSFYGDETSAVLPSIKMRLGDVQGAFEIFSGSGSEMGMAIANLKMGYIKSLDSLYKEAENYYLTADSIFEKIQNTEGISAANIALAKTFIETNRIGKASKRLHKAEINTINPENFWKIEFEKGRIYEAKARIDSAYLAYSKAISIIEEIRGKLNVDEFRTSYMEDKMYVYEKMIMLLLGSNEQKDFPGLMISTTAEAFFYSERAKARSFLDLLGNSKIDAKNSSDTFLLQKDYYLKYQIQKLSKQLQQSCVGYYEKEYMTDELNALKKEFKENLQLIKLKNPDYKSLFSVEPPDLSEIQLNLSDNSAILEYWTGKDKMAIWLISNKGIKVKTVPISLEKIEKMVGDCRDLINPSFTASTTKQLKSLYDQLLLPFEKELKAYKSLVIVPHKSLHFLPFHALIDSKNNYLAEKYNVSYSPSSSILSYCQEKSKSNEDKFLGMALGDLSLSGFAGLPGTEHEVNQITNLYEDPTIKLKKETSETYIKTKGKDFNILHIATHGILDEKLPLFSYLLLSPDDTNDGQLTVNEIFNLNLQSKLVTLSACETGLGKLSKGDEMIGLSRAFIYAGTPAIIVSLWPVDDVSTAYIMTKLYQYYSSGYSLNESLTLAQRSLFDKNLSGSVARGLKQINWNKDIIEGIDSGTEEMKRNPYFWAPFILIGDPSK